MDFLSIDIQRSEPSLNSQTSLDVQNSLGLSQEHPGIWISASYVSKSILKTGFLLISLLLSVEATAARISKSSTHPSSHYIFPKGRHCGSPTEVLATVSGAESEGTPASHVTSSKVGCRNKDDIV